MLETVKDLSIIFAGVVALVTFVVASLEYARQTNTSRATHFVDMRRRFLETQLFREISGLLAKDDSRLTEISVQDRRNYVGFLEEVALMTNSKIIRPEVAHYMFGYYVLLADRSSHFWEGLDRQSIYWSVFRSFAKQMSAFESAPAKNLNALQF